MDEIREDTISDAFPPEGDVFAKSILQKEEVSGMSWGRYGGYKLKIIVKEFFCYKSRVIKVKDLNLEDTVKNLLEPAISTPSKDVLDKCKELLRHQDA